MAVRAEERTPYTTVVFQECERMNILMTEIKTSLKKLNLGLKVRIDINYTRYGQKSFGTTSITKNYTDPITRKPLGTLCEISLLIKVFAHSHIISYSIFTETF